MNTFRFPEQKIALSNKPYTRENLARIFEEIFRIPTRPFTGFLKVTTESNAIYFLFLLQSDPYAAGLFTGNKPFNISIADFIEETFADSVVKPSISLHETDPVLLKSLLIFLQDEPTVKAPVNLIDLEQIVRQINEEAADALVVLEKEQMFNFYFFKNGKAALYHMADTDWTMQEGLSIDEQMLLYAFDTGASPIVAYIYRTITTEQAADAEQISRQMLLDLIRGKSMKGDKTSIFQVKILKTINAEVIAGSDLGKVFTVSLPCSIGRKGCDIVINDSQVSRRHAVLHQSEGELIIEDQESTNGTFFNGEAIKRTTLASSDVINIGETSLKITF
jgi:hypothetical protein